MSLCVALPSRLVLQSWLNDATQNSNIIADSLLKQLYHWVSNPGSAVHHPELHKAVLGLMRALFVVLVEEMKRLGATVVAANFNSVLIYTGRRNLTAAGGAMEGGGRGWAVGGEASGAGHRCKWVLGSGWAHHAIQLLWKLEWLQGHAGALHHAVLTLKNPD